MIQLVFIKVIFPMLMFYVAVMALRDMAKQLTPKRPTGMNTEAATPVVISESKPIEEKTVKPAKRKGVHGKPAPIFDPDEWEADDVTCHRVNAERNESEPNRQCDGSVLQTTEDMANNPLEDKPHFDFDLWDILERNPAATLAQLSAARDVVGPIPGSFKSGCR